MATPSEAMKDAVFGLMASMHNAFEELPSASVAYKNLCVAAGFSEGTAEQMALLYHNHLMNMMMKTMLPNAR